MPERASREASCLCSVFRRGLDTHLAKHARFHVIKKMAMKCPATKGIGGDSIRQALPRLHGDGVLADQEFSVLRLHFAPHAMQVNGMIHHAVVHEHETQTLAMVESQGLALRELLAAE